MVQKKVIIVGASSGIGQCLACKYVEDGWMVGITGRRDELLQQLVARFPGRVISSSFDVMKSDIRQKLDNLIEKLGGLDLLIYNAGFGDPSIKLVWEVEHDTTRTNVNGFVETVAYIFNYFEKQGYGHIALTSSVAALRGNGWTPAYSASKAFMCSYAEGLSIKAWKMKKKIFITDLRPGFVATKMSKGNVQFWVAPVDQAAYQIMTAIRRKKRVAYITRRWWLIAQLLKILPFAIYKRLG